MASRSGSAKSKARPKASSKLSFGGDSGDGDDEVERNATKKTTLGQRTLENNAIKKGLGTRGLPMRSINDEDDRPP